MPTGHGPFTEFAPGNVCDEAVFVVFPVAPGFDELAFVLRVAGAPFGFTHGGSMGVAGFIGWFVPVAVPAGAGACAVGVVAAPGFVPTFVVWFVVGVSSPAALVVIGVGGPIVDAGTVVFVPDGGVTGAGGAAFGAVVAAGFAGVVAAGAAAGVEGCVGVTAGRGGGTAV